MTESERGCGPGRVRVLARGYVCILPGTSGIKWNSPEQKISIVICLKFKKKSGLLNYSPQKKPAPTSGQNKIKSGTRPGVSDFYYIDICTISRLVTGNRFPGTPVGCRELLGSGILCNDYPCADPADTDHALCRLVHLVIG